jgi:hypothetical protein
METPSKNSERRVAGWQWGVCWKREPGRNKSAHSQTFISQPRKKARKNNGVGPCELAKPTGLGNGSFQVSSVFG